MNSRGSFSSVDLLLKYSSLQHDVAQHFKTRHQGYQLFITQKKIILQARLDEIFSLPEKKR